MGSNLLHTQDTVLGFSTKKCNIEILRPYRLIKSANYHGNIILFNKTSNEIKTAYRLKNYVVCRFLCVGCNTVHMTENHFY